MKLPTPPTGFPERKIPAARSPSSLSGKIAAATRKARTAVVAARARRWRMRSAADAFREAGRLFPADRFRADPRFTALPAPRDPGTMLRSAGP